MGIWKSEWKPLLLVAAVFAAALYLPVGSPRFDGVTMTPALVVDGQVKLQGRVLSAEKLKELIA